MKRGFRLAILTLFIFTTFSGFVTPEKGYTVTFDYAACYANNGGDATACEAARTAFNAVNTTEPTTPQTDTTGFYANCLQQLGGDTASNKTTCSDQLNAITLQNNGGIDPAIQRTIDDYAKKLYDAEATAQIKYTNCLSKNNANESKCTTERTTYNEATKAIDDYIEQIKPSGYSLTNSQQRRSQTIGPFKKTCNILSDPLACIDTGIAWFITHTLLEIAGWFLWLGSELLDMAIKYGILNFASWAPDGITNLWKLVRDALYIVIVFIGFYLAFMFTIGLDQKFKKFIPWLIVFALFVNFSLPITKAMIDMSNIVALNIYNSAVPAGSNQSAGTEIMKRLGIQSLLAGEKSPLSEISSTPVALLAVAMVLFAAWIFFQIAILIMIRTLVLLFILIGSPFLLIDSMVTIPAFGEHVRKIRSLFFNQLFLADVFMIMFFLTLQIMSVLKPLGELGTNIQSLTGGVAGSGNIGLFFGITMMLLLLHFMLKITKSMGGEVGSFATGMVNTGVGMLAGGVALRGGAMLGRATVGRLASNTLGDTSKGLGKWINQNQDSFLGKRAYNLTNSLANSSFDGRNTGIAQKFSGSTGMKLGAGGNLGYRQTLDNEIKDKRERQNRIVTINKDGTKNQAGVEAKKRFKENAGYGGIIGGALGSITSEKRKEEIMENLSDAEKEMRRDSFAKYKTLDKDEKEEFKSKQDETTKKKIEEYEAKIETEKTEREEDRKLRKESVAYQGDMAKAIQEQNKIAKNKIENEQPQNEKRQDFEKDIKEKQHQNNQLNISRGGKTSETVTAGGIIIPKSASL